MTNQEMIRLLKGDEQSKAELRQYLMGKLEDGFPLTPTELSVLLTLNGE